MKGVYVSELLKRMLAVSLRLVELRKGIECKRNTRGGCQVPDGCELNIVGAAALAQALWG